MASGFYVKRGEKEQGPFSSKELKSFAASGKLRKTDKIRKENSKKYYAAESVQGLFDVKASNKKRRPAPKPDEEDYGVEVIEEAGSAADFDTDYDEFEDVGEFDDVAYADDFDEYEAVEEYEPEPKRKSRSRGASAPPARRGSKSKKSRASAGKPKKKKPVKKDTDEDDEEEDGPWANLFYGLCCIAGGVIFFFVLREGSPDDWGRRGGLVKLVVQLLYYIGGEWAVLVILSLGGLLLIGTAVKQFREG